MHIPDGYLSPSTCVGLYGGAAPFWYVAMRRVKRELDSRTIPLLSMFAAFSFVVMLFNLPLPGGTTGHAVGMGVASIVLGPWVSVLAISVALVIQALLFGDGGITTLGANCFNMAVIGSFAAFAVYRLLSMGADITSRRRVLAAGLGGYCGINAAALFAGIEFGIQPLLFHTASGAPLYAPYPLSVSAPAMMFGHLTFAGLAELILSAGIVAYLQRADPGLLRRTAPGARCTVVSEAESDLPQRGRSLRPLWIALGVLLVVSPLGILATGSAWGEWRSPSIWSAPLSAYAPIFIRNRFLGYLVSALMGAGVIVVALLLVSRLLFRRSRGARRVRRTRFVEATVSGLLTIVEQSLFAEGAAQSKGLLQALEPRVKLAGLIALIACTVAMRRLWILAALFLFAILLALLSKIPVRQLAVRVWMGVAGFTGLIALPALFLVPGETLFGVPLVGWSVTAEGGTSALFLVLRAETAATFAFLLVLSTPWNRLLRALRSFRVPVVMLVILETAYRFIFVLLQTAQNMFESRRARLVGDLAPPEQRRLAAATIGVLLDKSLQFSTDVHVAMQARGFRGEAILLDDRRLGPNDWLQLFAFLAFALTVLWGGR
jgi:cobalt/nickel transport system permease protein